MVADDVGYPPVDRGDWIGWLVDHLTMMVEDGQDPIGGLDDGLSQQSQARHYVMVTNNQQQRPRGWWFHIGGWLTDDGTRIFLAKILVITHRVG